MRFFIFASVCVVGMLECGRAVAQDHGGEGEVAVVLKDGSTLVGHVLQQDESHLKVRTQGGLELDVPRSSVVSVRSRGQDAAAPRLTDPNYSRLMFAPTGRPLLKGDGYFSNHYVLFPGFSYGFTDNLSLSGGLSTIPALGLNEQLYYVSPKVGARVSDGLWLSAGLLYARAGGEDGLDLGIGFAVATFERARGSVSLGVGLVRTVEERYAYPDDVRKEASYTPILMLGGKVPLSKRLALVSENWLVLGEGFDLAEQPFGLSLRFLGDRLSADVGVILVGDVLKEGAPIPWLSFTYHFGPSTNGQAARSLPPPLPPRAPRAKVH